MSKKTIEHAVGVLKEIKAEVKNGVIKSHEMLVLRNMETGRETGFAVVLTLSTKCHYPSKILEKWRKLLEAEEYVVIVSRNQLRITFTVMF